MANSTVADLSLARSAITGAIFWGPPGTTLPTDATTALAAGFQNLGHIGDGGISPARDVSVDDVTDMNGDVLQRIQTGFAKAYSAPMLAVRNEYLNNAIFGDANVTVTAADATNGKRIAVIDAGVVSDLGVMVIELTTSSTGRERRVLPVAQVTSAEEGDLVGTSVQTYTVTYTAYKDNAGNFEYRYYTDGVPTA